MHHQLFKLGTLLCLEKDNQKKVGEQAGEGKGPITADKVLEVWAVSLDNHFTPDASRRLVKLFWNVEIVHPDSTLMALMTVGILQLKLSRIAAHHSYIPTLHLGI